MLFLAFTLGSVVAAVGGLAFLWAPGVPAVLLSAYIAHLRAQERRRFAFQMDRRQAEAAAQRLRDRDPRPRRRGPAPAAPGTVGDLDAEEPDDGPETESGAGMSALAADRRALVEQTDHAEWVDQQRERRGRPQGDSWDPVPVPLPTYVTAPVAPAPRPTWTSRRRTRGARPAPRPSHPTRRTPPGPPARTGTARRTHRRTHRPRSARRPRPAAVPAVPRRPAGPGSGAARRSSTSTTTATAPARPTSSRKGFLCRPDGVLEFHSLQGPVAQSGSAPRSHRGGLGFKSPQVHAH